MKIEFNLTEYALCSGAVISAAREAFGERVARYANCRRTLRVRCDSDQFVLFLQRRNQLGGTNSWKDLNVELFDVKSERSSETFVDVSK